MAMKSTDLYQKVNAELWKGRVCDPQLGTQYWYQAVHQIDLMDASDLADIDVAIIGYACDAGVRRNQGRAGAIHGPDAIRNRLAKVAWHHDTKRVADVGSLICSTDNLEDFQIAFAAEIHQLLDQDVFPIALGGGHDIAYAHFRGMYDWLIKKDGPSKIGIINFDAHFDLRPLATSANSGTPFNQILTEMDLEKVKVSYLPVGIQERSNTKELFDIAKEKGVDWVTLDVVLNHETSTIAHIVEFVAQHDFIYVTIDLDGFSSAYAPGVSASSPFGLTPSFVLKSLKEIFNSGKVLGLDLAEMNPKFDRDETTAKLAAGLVDVAVGNC